MLRCGLLADWVARPMPENWGPGSAVRAGPGTGLRHGSLGLHWNEAPEADGIVRDVEHIAPCLEQDRDPIRKPRGTRPPGHCSIPHALKHLARIRCAPAYPDPLIRPGSRCG